MENKNFKKTINIYPLVSKHWKILSGIAQGQISTGKHMFCVPFQAGVNSWAQTLAASCLLGSQLVAYLEMSAATPAVFLHLLCESHTGSLT